MLGRIFLGRYEAVRLLGEGGMGRVYLAKQLALGRQVAVKVMHDHIAADPKFRERFQRETLLMARFQHPYVVALYDASVNDPQGPCIVMEYIRGITLDTLLKRNGRLSPARAGRLLGQLCEALQAAHGQNIVHRDLKPANLMVVDGDTPYEKLKVMDFGLAKLLVQNPFKLKKASDTGADFAVGTPGYISPEQVRGDEQDHRSDLYSVGVILFELLCGRLPFTGDQTMDVMLAHATESPPSFESIGASAWVAPPIERVVQRCLAKNPTERPASARDLAEQYNAALLMELEQADGQPAHVVVNEPPASAPSAPKPASAPVRQVDPYEVVHEMEAWMPEAIASYKLRGFVQDVGGEVVESLPGLIRVRLGGKGSVYHLSPGPFSWLGLGKQVGLVNMDLHLERSTAQLQNRLRITVKMRPPDKSLATNPTWRARASRIFCDLRAYLVGDSVEST
ncbi:MAG: serine/threonine protein kinase [Planctomycetes bacterium]|nr:serine/threonine protein kinase [Planctomycetota bacterium]